MKEVKCYALEVIMENMENFNEEMQYIANSFKANKGFVGVHVTERNRIFALFRTYFSRDKCYYRINSHYNELKPRVVLVMQPAYVEKRYLMNN